MVWGEELVWGALRDLGNSGLSEKEKALFRFVAKVNHQAPKITPEDMKPLHDAGWNDDAIDYAITVCALFNFYNRWIDAAGVHEMSEEAQRQYAARTAQQGYTRNEDYSFLP